MAYQTINPATGTVEMRFDTISDAALDDALNTARTAFESDWRRRSIDERATIVRRAAALMREEAPRLAALVVREMGKLLAQAEGEVALSASILDYYADHAAHYLKPERIDEHEGANVHRLPIGVILGVEPWNFPYYQLARVAGPQLMVGNVLMVKHAGSVPQCAAAFEDVMRRAGAPDGVYTNIYASTDQVARLIEDPRIAGVTVTGSERAGAAVAAQAGKNLKKSVMELGGSDPLIVLPDAPFGATLDNIMWGRMNNTGQSCVASKRIIVVGAERAAAFLDAIVKRMAALVPGDPMDAATTLGPLSSEDAVEHILDQIRRAEAAGAVVRLGGHRLNRPGFYVEATVLTDIDESNPIYREELFGPVISFYAAADEAEALKIANAVPFGLGGSVFTADLERGEQVALAIESGMAFVNNPTWTAPELPFGGTKNSGYGRELSELGFGEFVNAKLIAVSPVGAPPPGVAQAG
ncbi:NAD-dependent succinate-semialdehyde dehydrogenase [Acuticoccus yangtzensis]|uniref:NAD-dependent succinate-semialdehyde dehydrogenase n=1 Tax=Acuticoccus yangtzensis TaxID=1443441 RepID=UPI0009497EF2|nr:NAD-dependent succinate-semialdehyde dehydrogenase [Acuticoccus yangtzensis]